MDCSPDHGSEPGRERGWSQRSTHHPGDGKLIKLSATDAPTGRRQPRHSNNKADPDIPVEGGDICGPFRARKMNTAMERKRNGSVF